MPDNAFDKTLCIVKKEDLKHLVSQFKVNDKTLPEDNKVEEKLIRLLAPLECTIKVIDNDGTPIQGLSKILSNKPITEYLIEWPDEMQVYFNQKSITLIQARSYFSKQLNTIMNESSHTEDPIPQTSIRQQGLYRTPQQTTPSWSPRELLPKGSPTHSNDIDIGFALLKLSRSP